MIVIATWEFDVDDSWGETPEECIKIAKNEFATITADDVEFQCRPDMSSIYEGKK